jgi:two-component system chemotaxis response regulator CheY
MKILVIDDSRTVLLFVRQALEGAGYAISTCQDAKTAGKMAAAERFDLIITDIYMPDGDGLDVIRDLRVLHPGLPFLAMSGMTGQLNMLRVAKLLGARHTLQKPFLARDLLAAVEAAIGKCLPAGSPPHNDLPGATSGQPPQNEDSS